MRRRAVAVIAGTLCVFALAGCGSSDSSDGSLPLPCAPQPDGALCIKVSHDGLKVQDAIGYLSASRSPLARKTWRLVLRVGGRTYPGRTRHGNPPSAISCNPGKLDPECHDKLAADYASFGDFVGFDPPKELVSGTQVCVAEQRQDRGRWTTEAQPAPACSSVS